MDNRRFLDIVSQRTLDLLTERKAMLFEDGTVFYTWPRADRLVIIFDPHAIDSPLRGVRSRSKHSPSLRQNMLPGLWLMSLRFSTSVSSFGC